MITEATDIRRNLETNLIQKAWKDPQFKRDVVSNPKGMLEQHLGKKLPLDLKIIVHEEDAHTLHFSIPPPPSNLSELSDEDLERVSGGTELVIVTVGMATLIASAVSINVTVKNGW